MSHIVGTVQPVQPALQFGPGSGAAADSPNIWKKELTPAAPPVGTTKLVLLHFTAASLPANNRIEVDLGYSGADTMDVFTSADGDDFWTRPINVAALGGKATFRYITNGSNSGSATLTEYGRGERHKGDQDPNALSNCDPFAVDNPYVDPKFDPHWFCSQPPHWDDIGALPDNDPRRIVSHSVGMILHVDESEFQTPNFPVLSTCSVTLIGPDLVITAGHCMATPAEHAKSSSVIFNYELAPGGGLDWPANYAPRFFKVKEVVAQFWNEGTSGGVDYCIFRLKVPPGLPPIQLRHDLPGAGEKMYCIHHPNGAVKKLSVPIGDPLATAQSSDTNGVFVSKDLHVSGGTSGSGLFDAAGRIVGVLADGDPCFPGNFFLRWFPTATILDLTQNPPADPPATRDVMLVIDKSGSMSLPGKSGRPKLEEAQDAASLFVQLVRAVAGNKLGLVSFSTGSHLDFSLHGATAVNKKTLVGDPPYIGGKVGDLIADGSTTIGGGLKTAGSNMPDNANPRSILLLTDGLENTGPMIAENQVQDKLGGIEINAIGYGSDADLDGDLLSQLAADHQGQYHRADSSLQLEKYFSQAFGNIFESGLLSDPEFTLGDEDFAAKPYPFRVCGEESVTIVVGWDNLATELRIEVHTPLGATFQAGAAGTTTATGRTWTFLKVPLPHNGERDGLWQVVVYRIKTGPSEFPDPAPATRYFVNVVAAGGPTLRRVRRPGRDPHYTGDWINPLLSLSYGSGGGSPENIKVMLTVTHPTVSAGNLLSQHGLGAPKHVGNDTIPARQATLQAIEAQTGQPAIPYGQTQFELLGGPSNTNGAFEPEGLYGRPMSDLLKVEGTYSFHAVATYGEDCVSSRELHWSIHIAPGIDPGRTTTTTNPTGHGTGTVTVTPRDPYGNAIGPGRGGGLTITGGAGTTVTGPVADNGDGSYTVPVSWDPAGGDPTVVVGQPGRPPVVVGGGGGGSGTPAPGDRRCWWCMMLCAALALLLLLILWLWWHHHI
jgi:Trypsin-like peptidase domain/von Willebrand factor type A domain